MSEDYKSQINNQIKDVVNQWIEDLKQKHPTLLLTKQWNVLYPKGFHAGNNIIAVVSGSKKGKHLVAELNIFLPDNLELDLKSVELLLKNEPYKVEKKPSAGGQIPRPIDEPLDTLNDIILSINQFLQSIHVPETFHPIADQAYSSKSIIRPSQPHAKNINIKQNSAPANVDEVKKEMLYSPALPEWYRTIESPSVKADLAQKLAESFVSYQQQTGRKIEFVEFFNIFSEHLKTQNKLHHYCRYKGQPVKLDSNNFCTESFCSKKPYNSVCNQTTLKFGEP
ncbi:MAG: hypothetical protein D8M58_21480 [Calditrichaeota bacterium]|nr:MAG: hypothetical protein DWQ03_00205 [Calditrichota bacterium]MBL1207986.1 hypothetical protein [Calditrichota bacterium]NOG47823.1 hypothetical protein [Calditrichota bacterium]